MVKSLCVLETIDGVSAGVLDPTTPPLHHSVPLTSTLHRAFWLIAFIGRLANIVPGCLSRRDIMKIARRFNAGNDGKCPSPAGTADAAAFPALGRAGIAFSESQPSLRDLSASRVPPGVETPGYYRASLRDCRRAYRGAASASNTSSPLKKPPGESTEPTTHADSQGNIVDRVPSRGEQDVFERAARTMLAMPL